jgi:hypothetical protein
MTSGGSPSGPSGSTGSEFTPTFRRAVVCHLSDLDGCAPGRKALLAIARSVRELRSRESAR